MYQPEEVYWTFGHPRSGTTWAAKMLASLVHGNLWNEPGVGRIVMFRTNISTDNPLRLTEEDFWFADPNRDKWQPLLEQLFADIISTFAPPPDYDRQPLVLKEPNSTDAAGLIASIAPRARIIVMLRDPRDIIASLLDARKPGSWMDQRVAGRFDRQKIIRQSVRRINRMTRSMVELHREAQAGQVYEIRYERLRSHPESELMAIAEHWQLEIDNHHIHSVVDEHSYENIPEVNKGPGQFVRNATVGSWQEELAADEVDWINTRLRDAMEYLGYGSSSSVR